LNLVFGVLGVDRFYIGSIALGGVSISVAAAENIVAFVT
jgi:hypothetical protein